ncbi:MULTISPECIES: hypothetical protein [Shewanella]|uniref:Uncharacterized protein n=1 Tax=Shewanella chilikensis TaxID=558541 RepID=A0ABX5PTD2_9GAMM|nr:MULTISPECIES: hypothetical protein [Shewanella]AYV12351.1 hypothetical protein EEY24_05310 [Shewanella algae]MBO2550977.1 hypothetical protein [Shewanella algae]MBO2563780.1 hypothetical protein [Shewanella algae]MBO2665176.1 hypothetical protein [Shewanella algae]MBO2673652.1 hypothetical protein [Shewanella algae]
MSEGNVISIETAEEREAFEFMANRQKLRQQDSERQQQIAKMAAIAARSHSTSFTGICARLYDAGCRLPDDGPEAA